MSIVDLLSRLGECSEQEDLIQLIPETILLQNYVHFRVVLKKYVMHSLFIYNYLCHYSNRLINDLQKKLSSESLSVVPQKKTWEDFVDDLWKNNLTQFRHGNYSYAVVSTADQRRRVYSLRNIDRNDEDLLNDLMKAGVSESNLLPDTDVDESSSRSPSLNSRLSQPSVLYTGRDDADDVESSIATSLSNNQGKFTQFSRFIKWIAQDSIFIAVFYKPLMPLYMYIVFDLVYQTDEIMCPDDRCNQSKEASTVIYM